MSLVGLKIASSNLANTVSARYTHLMIPTHIDVLIFFGRDMVRSLPSSFDFQMTHLIRLPDAYVLALAARQTHSYDVEFLGYLQNLKLSRKSRLAKNWTFATS
jgi:hypothetical protein